MQFRPVFLTLLFLSLLVVASPAGGSTPATAPSPIKILRIPGGLRFGLIGARGDHPSPTLFVLGHGLETMQQEPIYSEVAGILLKHGVLSVIIDPPAHGEDVRPGEPANAMQGWRLRLEKGEDFVGAFTTNARNTLDYLVKEGYSDPNRIAACGISRGGFLAFHFAAVDPRVKAVAGISPLTDLLALREFTGTTHREEAAKLSIIALAPKLAGRAVWVSIGNNDQRVDTDLAIAFTRAVVRAGAAQVPKPDAIIPVELIVAPTAGHSRIDHAHDLLADWILRQFGMDQIVDHSAKSQ